MSDLLHDPGVDPDDYDQEMSDAPKDEAGGVAQRCVDPVSHGAPALPFARRGRSETRYQMELGRKICGLIQMRASGPLITERGMLRDMYGLMRHVVGGTTGVT